MKQIRICNVDEEGRFGGPERRIVQVAKALKKYGVDTHVVYPKYDSEIFAQELSRARISCSALSITRLSKEKKVIVRYVLFFLIEIYRLCIFFRRYGYDLVHVNGSYQFKVAIAAKLARIPVVWHLNDTKMSTIIKKICIYTAKYCAAGFIVAGKRVRKFYILGNGLENKPYAEIHAPVDTTVFDPNYVNPEKKVAQATGRKIVTVSGINPTKGLEYFIQMASNLQKRHDDLSFFIAGAEFSSQRKYYQQIKNLITSSKLRNTNFMFVGMINNVPSFLKGADICVFTSIAEASPTSIWEAMSMGRAVVTTDVGSVSQYIDNGISGFIVPIKDVKALSDRVDILLENPGLRQKMGIEARIVAQKHLDISSAAEKHAFIYRQILSTHSAPFMESKVD